MVECLNFIVKTYILLLPYSRSSLICVFAICPLRLNGTGKKPLLL